MFTHLTPLLNHVAITCSRNFFGLKPWYAYLQPDPARGCAINLSDPLGSSSNPVLLIGLAIVDDLLRVAALVAVGYVIYGGIQFITSQGAPDATTKARETIINALIGVGIAVIAAGIVSFIGTKLGNIS